MQIKSFVTIFLSVFLLTTATNSLAAGDKQGGLKQQVQGKGGSSTENVQRTVIASSTVDTKCKISDDPSASCTKGKPKIKQCGAKPPESFCQP